MSILISVLLLVLAVLVIFTVGIIKNKNIIVGQATELKFREKMFGALSEMSTILLSQKKDAFGETMSLGLRPIADEANVDRIIIYNLVDGKRFGQAYNWDRAQGGTTLTDEALRVLPQMPAIDNWIEILTKGDCINLHASVYSDGEAALLNAYGVKSILLAPVVIDGELWGAVSFEDRTEERFFSVDCVDFLRSAAFMCASAVVRDEMEHAIADASERTKLMLDSTPLCCQLFDSNFKKIDCNQEAIRLFGFKDKHDFLERSHELYPEFQSDSQRSVEKIKMYLEKAARFGRTDVFDWTYRMLDGTAMPAEAVIVRLPYGNDFLLAAYTRDLREHVKMMKEIEERDNLLRKALELAEAGSKAKGDFLSTMSHEMRTPMNAIIGMTTIGKKATDIEEKNHALSKIGDASSHLLGVINDVLDMAKIEANKLELAPIEYNFERMLQKVMTVVHFRADEKQQTLSVNVDKKIPRFLVGDDQRLSQVITNLLSNAVKFTPEGGNISFDAVLIEMNDEICELRIEISDSGIGISPEKQTKLFKAFEQAESGTNREYGGTGLGLVIAKRIVELMDGSIWVESDLGKGAKFIFTVKMRLGEKNPRSLLAPDVNWETVRILAVDDVLEIREQFQDIFGHLNITCDVAADGVEACQIIEERGGYDIYFIDWRMPRMDGIELTRRIKSNGTGRPSVVIMITAMDWEQIKNEATRAGVDRHLLKPLFSSTVIDCVNECLGTARKGKDIEEAHGEFAGKRMLLAEDIEINREIILALLEDTGFTIDCAENGQDALNMIAADPNAYDIVFMDVQMPKMDGHEATRRIRALPALQGVSLPIVAMTANVFKSDIEACLAAGMDAHLGKPVDIDRVLEVLRKYLGKK